MNTNVYVVQTQVINLGELPLSNSDELKPAFRKMFTSRNCFADLRNSIMDLSRVEPREDRDDEAEADLPIWERPAETLIPLPGTPFIPRLGMLCFNTRSAIFNDNDTRALLATEVSRHEDFWDPKSKKLKYHYDQLDVFGYNHELEDQRMNMLYFELHQPVFLSACTRDKKMATGRLFLHFYPSGYLVLQLAVKLITPGGYNEQDLIKGIYETQPWRKPTTWQWSSRIAQGSLQQLVDTILQLIFDGLYESKPSRKIQASKWYTSIRLFPGWDLQKLADTFFTHNVQSTEIKPAKWNLFDTDFDDGNSEKGRLEQSLIVSKEGLIRCLPEGYGAFRKRSLGEFWKILTIAEYTLLKDKIFADYAAFLRPEIHRLRDFRLSLKRKMMKDDVLKFTAYRSELPRYLFALNEHIHSANAYYRFIYSRVADGLGLYARYEKLDGLVKEWTGEVEQWEPSLSVLWNRVIGPLRSLLGAIR
jgi:hypothetical protein